VTLCPPETTGQFIFNGKKAGGLLRQVPLGFLGTSIESCSLFSITSRHAPEQPISYHEKWDKGKNSEAGRRPGRHFLPERNCSLLLVRYTTVSKAVSGGAKK
jgi:hypothetical protein